MDYSRIHRLLKILTLIQGEKGWTPARLALECGTTQRTIYRDMKMLEGAGIPYFFDEETKGYRVRKDFFMPPVQLTLDESLALAALAERVGGDEQVPFTEAAARAISKVRSALPQAIRSELEQIEDRIAIKLAAASPPEASKDVYRTAQAAIIRRVALRCCYDSLAKDAKKKANEIFLFKPYTLFFNQRAWYVVGHHEGRKGVRCLKLNRFTKFELTDESFTIATSFSLEKHLGNAWRMIKGKKAYDVELWFDPQFADTVSDTHWHKTQEVEWNDDESITFRCKVDGLEEIVWWVLGYGPHCVVKQPKALADQVKALGLAIAERYSKKSPILTKA
jgi:predicted DNA-binding transcriptional regulator YafY